MIGVDPGPFSLRELVEMHRAKRDHDWDLFAALMSLIANRHRGRSERRYRPDDFRPRGRGRGGRGGIAVTADNINVLKVFLPKEG